MVWLTGAGLESAGLGGVRAVKSPPGATTIARGVLAAGRPRGSSTAGERGSQRELALEHDRWAVTMRCERGYTDQLPDLAVWLKDSKAPGAVIAESGGRREDRQKMILEGWRDALWSGRYTAVRYACASPSVAHWINRLASKVGLTDSTCLATMQTTAEEIAALSPTPLDDGPAFDGPGRQPNLSAWPGDTDRTRPSTGTAEAGAGATARAAASGGPRNTRGRS